MSVYRRSSASAHSVRSEIDVCLCQCIAYYNTGSLQQSKKPLSVRTPVRGWRTIRMDGRIFAKNQRTENIDERTDRLHFLPWSNTIASIDTPFLFIHVG